MRKEHLRIHYCFWNEWRCSWWKYFSHFLIVLLHRSSLMWFITNRKAGSVSFITHPLRRSRQEHFPLTGELPPTPHMEWSIISSNGCVGLQVKRRRRGGTTEEGEWEQVAWGRGCGWSQWPVEEEEEEAAVGGAQRSVVALAVSAWMRPVLQFLQRTCPSRG